VDALDAKLGLFMRKGDASFSEQKYHEAVAWYEQVTEADPKHAQAFTMLAAAHYMSGGIGAAMKNFDRALDIEPKSLNALVRSGQLHLQVCNLDRSRKDFNAALAIEPGHPEAGKAAKDIHTIQQRLETAKVCCALCAPASHSSFGSGRVYTLVDHLCDNISHEFEC
jgi:tetratricopeptide (TPR) repeat protein